MGEEGDATRYIAAPLRVLFALVVVSGLLAAAPAACWCPSDDHVGQLLHPRFAHAHASDHAPARLGDEDDADAEAMSLANAPAWSSAAGQGLSGWQAGVQVLPPLMTVMHIEFRMTRPAFDVARPVEHVPGPTFPPPR